MKAPRFVFLTVAARRDRPERSIMDGVIWMLVSPNNRPLGRCEKPYETYGAAVVVILIRRRRRVSASPSPGPAPAAVSAG